MPDDYKGIPLVGIDFGVPDGTVVIFDRAAFERETLVTDFKLVTEQPERDLWTDFQQARMYSELMFHQTELEHVQLKRRADAAMDRVLNSRDPFGRQWRRDLWTHLKLSWKATRLRHAHPERRVPAPRNVAMITGLV